MSAGLRKTESFGDMVNEHSFILHKTPQDGKNFRGGGEPGTRFLDTIRSNVYE